jgi:hypothetical protein
MGLHPQYSLCLGGACLIFLIALAQRSNADAARFARVDWTRFVSPNGTPVAFVAPQGPPAADRTVHALFDVFAAIVSRKPDWGDQGTAGLGVTDIEFPDKGKPYFRLKLAWTDPQREGFTSAMNNAIQLGLTSSTGTIGLPPGKTTGLFLRLLLATQVRTEGFGATGAVVMQPDGWLRVGR